MEVFATSNQIIKRPFIIAGDSLLTTRDRHCRNLAATFEKLNQQIYFCLHSNGAFLCEVPVCGAYKHNVVHPCNWFLGAYFVWVPIILLVQIIMYYCIYLCLQEVKIQYTSKVNKCLVFCIFTYSKYTAFAVYFIDNICTIQLCQKSRFEY